MIVTTTPIIEGRPEGFAKALRTTPEEALMEMAQRAESSGTAVRPA